jgi:hypothetical protein
VAGKSWLAEWAGAQDAYDFLDFWFFSSRKRTKKKNFSQPAWNVCLKDF